MFTKDQENYLKEFADKALAEKADIEARNAAIEVDLKVTEAREAKKAELKAQADTLIEEGLQEFETKVVPTLN